AEPNEFEAHVQRELERAGLSVIPQFGASTYRIDLAVQDPERPGRCVLAVECDGVAYHSSPMARDRDRLRQEHLEQRGWRFVRVWSAAWYANQAAEVARILDVYQRLVRGDGADERPPAALADRGSNRSAPNPNRGRWPNVARGLPATAYSELELDRVARW